VLCFHQFGGWRLQQRMGGILPAGTEQIGESCRELGRDLALAHHPSRRAFRDRLGK